MGDAPLEAAASLDDLLVRHSLNTPDALALKGRGHTLTYAQLNVRVEDLARRLRSVGALAGGAVGVRLGDVASDVVALLGVLRSGCAYVPLDPSLPPERVARMVDECGVRLVVDGDLLETVAETGESRTPGPADLPPGTAYVIYTSGSTGIPKGCPVTHSNVLALLRAALPLFDVGTDDRWSLFHSLAFDFSVWELWGALATGGAAIVVDADTKLEARTVLRLLHEERVTVVCQVPSFFRALIRSARDLGVPDSLRYVVFGGEPLDVAAVRDFWALSAGPRIVNMYGLTEATVHATFCELTPSVLDSADPAATPIGEPLPHLSFLLTTDDGRVAPLGTDADLLVAGPAVTEGYLLRPELNAERFVRRDAGDGEKTWYRTGDVVRRDPGRHLVYVGRRDAQVKLRGYRIELGEIESALRSHPRVSDAGAWVQRGVAAEFLCAAVVLFEGPDSGPDSDLLRELRRHAQAALPRWAAPNRYFVRAALPRTSGGKLDRANLSEAYAAGDA